MKTGFSEEEVTVRTKPRQHLLCQGAQLFVTQIHEQPVRKDQVKTVGRKSDIRPSMMQLMHQELLTYLAI